MRFYFKNRETYTIEFTEGTSKEVNAVKHYVRFTSIKNGILLTCESDRTVELYWSIENNKDLLNRESLYTLS